MGPHSPPIDPGVWGEWIIILFVAWTIYTSIREMIDSIRHGHIGVDLLAIVALVSTVCVQQYWASWAVVLMVASGEAIESYAQNKARAISPHSSKRRRNRRTWSHCPALQTAARRN